MREKHSGLYHALVVLPDHVYPFKTQVAGQWVRGVRSYNATLARIQRQYGAGHYGFKLDAYRQVFHLAGSILFLSTAAYLSQRLFGSPNAIYVFLAIAIGFITFQEFYLQRKTYRQLWRKGILDWLTWCVPMGVYFFTRIH
ncbi:MAG: hypothetical protein B7W98_01185 [Parcubacteria group bacterium 20-58-5]|nr:MAG: hypothetical protein B7W98_01185 [Parcubacteria group bacterium 20-58-5]OYV63561.1 MAG: hypothetical protein B7X03_01460 [Parcubacteria group bacterium 21-58-10]HQT82819.1 hypothetical protein [Candidatus Paceibacterota bacterium]